MVDDSLESDTPCQSATRFLVRISLVGRRLQAFDLMMSRSRA
jgi:hypothetical protein